MFYALLHFSGLPTIGFAHHFYTEHYRQQYGGDRSLELAYVKDGGITVELYGQSFCAEPGSLLVLCRHLPIRLYTNDGRSQAHCSVQLHTEYEFALRDEPNFLPHDFSGLSFPFVTPPCQQVEEIKKDLYSIVIDLSISRTAHQLSASLAAAGILYKLDNLHRKGMYAANNKPSLLGYQIKRFIARDPRRNFSISDLAEELGKTPNYLNAVFKKTNGMSIRQYINNEKVRLLADRMENMNMSFSQACESVGITDVSYGYRMFKKHMGVTPKSYLSGTRY